MPCPENSFTLTNHLEDCMNVKHALPAGFVILSALALSACGSSNSSPSTVLPASSPTPVPIPSASPFTSKPTVAAAPSVVAALPLPSIAGFSGAIDLSFPLSLPAGTTITTTVSNVEPTNAPKISSLLRSTLDLRNTLSANGEIVVLTYDDFVFSNAVTYETAPSFTLTIPAKDVVPASYYVALYDPTRPSLGWQLGFEGPAKIKGTTVTASSTSLTPFTFAKNANYYFALYAISSSAPAPTPAPSIKPIAPATATPNPYASAAPTSSPTVSPSSTPESQPTPNSQPTSASQPVNGGA